MSIFKHTRNHFIRSSATLSMLLGIGALTACAATNGSDPTEAAGPLGANDDEHPAIAAEPLTDYSGFKDWMKQRFDRDIPVCLNPYSVLNRPDADQLVSYWKHLVSRTWTQATGITFSGWKACTASDGTQPNAINIHILNASCAASTRLMTSDAVGVPYMLIMPCSNVVYEDTTMIHEFGHAIGFAHEADRKDFPTISAANCPSLGIANGTSTANTEGTLPDPFSIMNGTYCHWLIETSYQDNKGAQMAWGRPNYFADVTGDGADDAIVVNPDGIYVIANAGKVSSSGGHFTGVPTKWGGLLGAAEYNFVDVNGDKKADLVAGDANGYLKVFISDGTKFTRSTAEPAAGTLWRSTRGLFFADINGDGKTDAIRIVPSNFSITDTNKVFQVALSNGNTFGFGQATYLQNIPAPPQGVGSHGWFADVTGADADGKSRADYIYYGEGGIWVSKNFPTGAQSATAGFQKPTLWLAQRGSWNGSKPSPDLPLFFADINGDGKQDYVTSGESVSPGYPSRENMTAYYSTGTGFGSGMSVYPGYDNEKGIFAAKLSKTSNARSLTIVNKQAIYAYDIASSAMWNLTGRPYYGGSLPKTLFTLGSAYSNNVLGTAANTWVAANAIDGNASTSYSSNFASSSSNGNGWAFLEAWLPTQQTVNSVVLTARALNDRPQAFPPAYDIYLTAPDNSAWNYIGHYTAQPTSPSWKVVIPLGADYATYGIHIVPTELGTDDFGGHYFQLADVQLGLAK